MIRVIAKIFLRENTAEIVIGNIPAFLEAARKEEGCISYELFRDVNSKNVLVMIEEWASPEALQKHMGSQLFQQTMANLAPIQEKDMEVTVCTKVA